MNPLISAQVLLENEQRIRTLKSLIPTMIEEYEVNARLKREKFIALKREGFTEEQAMEIIIAGKDSMTL